MSLSSSVKVIGLSDMLRHVVLYKLNDGRGENAKHMVELFLSMRGKVAGLVQLDAGVNEVDSERAYDVALECLFTNRAALEAYKECSVHLAVKEFVHSVITQSHSVDYEI